MKKVLLTLVIIPLILLLSSSLYAYDDDKPDYCIGEYPYEDLPYYYAVRCREYEDGYDDLEIPDELYEDYDYIRLDDGKWYGIIEPTNSKLIGEIPNSYTGTYQYSSVYIEFNRDTENLTSITLDYKVEDSCDGWSVFGFCPFSDVIEGEEGTYSVYDDSDNGAWHSYLFNTDTIQHAPDNSLYTHGENFDYKIKLNELDPLEWVDIIEFSYILTDDEVDDINNVIQFQYDREINNILRNNDLSIEEREYELNELNATYADMNIEYQQEITSLCESDKYCKIITSSPSSPSSPSSIIENLQQFIITVAVLAVIGMTILILGLDVLVDLLSFTMNTFYLIATSIAYLAYNLLWLPVFNGFAIIFKTLLNLIFWWV